MRITIEVNNSEEYQTILNKYMPMLGELGESSVAVYMKTVPVTTSPPTPLLQRGEQTLGLKDNLSFNEGKPTSTKYCPPSLKERGLGGEVKDTAIDMMICENDGGIRIISTPKTP